jgi:putative endonuclease
MVKRWEAGDSPGKAGFQAESLALQHLLKAGLRLVQRNYRVARGPGARAGEIDLIMREPDGTIVFVEVRARAAPVSAGAFGGAAASVGSLKQRRIVFAAKHWLMRQAALPPCRFDVVALDGEHLQWLKAAFDAG